MKACFILVTLQLRALKRKNSSLPVSGTQYPNFLLPSSLTTLGKTGQQNEGVEFRRKPETPQAEPPRADGGRGHGSHRRPGYKPRLQRTQPPPDPGGAALARSPQAPEAKGDGTRAPLLPPPARGHTESRERRVAAVGPTSPILPSSHRPGDGHGRPEPGRADGGRRDGGAGVLPGRRALGLARAWGAAPGLGPAGDPRAAAERSRGRRRSECRSPGRGGGGVGGSREGPSERGLKPRFPHHRGEAQCLVLYEQPSCIYSLPP